MEGEKKYMRLNSVDVSQYVKMPFSPDRDVQNMYVLTEDFNMYAYHECMTTHKPEFKRLLHPTRLSALSEIAGVCCQGVFTEDNLSV